MPTSSHHGAYGKHRKKREQKGEVGQAAEHRDDVPLGIGEDFH